MSNEIASVSRIGALTGAPELPVEDLAARLIPGHRRRRPTTLLAVWAHPDDESVVGAGLIAAMTHYGARVVNVYATLGEHGTPDPVAEPPELLASVRRAEVTRALEHLGAQQPTVLAYGDGTCADVEADIAARRVGNVIDRVDPDLILTFGPDGVTGHPDHRAVGRWTRDAVAVRDDRIPLVTAATGVAWPADVVEQLHELDAFWPGYPDHRDPSPCQGVRVEGQVLDKKLHAMRAHSSQMGRVERHMGATGMRRMAAVEAYRPANRAAEQLFARDRAAFAEAA